MKWLVTFLVILLLVLQYRLWVGEGSFAEVVSLQRDIEAQQAELERLRARNQALQAEVDSLKNDLEAVEERARSDLGMIREDEVFLQVLEKPVEGEPAE
jgi:cell division protein FtsB